MTTNKKKEFRKDLVQFEENNEYGTMPQKEFDFIFNWIEYSLQEAVKEEQKRMIKELKKGTWPVYLRDTDLITRDRDVKIRRQMRQEIINWLTPNPSRKILK